MKFIDVPISKAHLLINAGATVLVTSGSEEKANVMTAAWQMPVSHVPSLVAIAIGCSRFTHRLIEESGEFVVCVPPADILEKVWCCGMQSGEKVDKFSACGLTPLRARMVVPPLVRECIAHIECRLNALHQAGDHSIFIGEVVAASAREGVFNEFLQVDQVSAKILHHLGGKAFSISGEILFLP